MIIDIFQNIAKKNLAILGKFKIKAKKIVRCKKAQIVFCIDEKSFINGMFIATNKKLISKNN